MHVSIANLAAALLWSAAFGLVTWFALTPLRRRSVSALLASLVLTGAAASMGAVWGAIHTMLVAGVGWRTVVVLTVFAGAVSAVAAVAVARRLARDSAVLRAAVAEVGEGRVPADGGPRLTAEVERIRTELRSTAAALAAAREHEAALESARRDLVSWVSHDLRTPLAGLRAMAEALEDGIADDPELYYKQIGLSVERLNRMVEDLFDLSRIQAGSTSRRAERVVLDDMVSDCISALTPLASAHGVRLVGSLGGRATVNGNGAELNRALTNLVANAIRHTRERGSVDVRVGMSTGQAEIVVSDECGGIPEPLLEQVFEVGFRGEPARTPQSGTTGAGLGLAITRGIVEAHHGTVAVSNSVGGCEFRILLPSVEVA